MTGGNTGTSVPQGENDNSEGQRSAVGKIGREGKYELEDEEKIRQVGGGFERCVEG
jgi:hypothetical protein